MVMSGGHWRGALDLHFPEYVLCDDIIT